MEEVQRQIEKLTEEKEAQNFYSENFNISKEIYDLNMPEYRAIPTNMEQDDAHQAVRQSSLALTNNYMHGSNNHKKKGGSFMDASNIPESMRQPEHETEASIEEQLSRLKETSNAVINSMYE